MARQTKVATTYDSGANNTARRESGMKNDGDWGNDTPNTEHKNNGDESLLNIVMEDYNHARDYVKDNYQDDWNDYWKCYNQIRTKRSYEGIADDFVPEAFTIIESVKSNIAGGKPKFTYIPMNERQRQDTLVINQMVDFYWNQNRMAQKTLNWEIGRASCR